MCGGADPAHNYRTIAILWDRVHVGLCLNPSRLLCLLTGKVVFILDSGLASPQFVVSISLNDRTALPCTRISTEASSNNGSCKPSSSYLRPHRRSDRHDSSTFDHLCSGLRHNSLRLLAALQMDSQESLNLDRGVARGEQKAR